MGNPTIDLPTEASPQEILAQEENAQFQGGGYDLPADASPTVLQAARLIQDRFRQKPQPHDERGPVSRFAGSAGGAAVGAMGGGDAASAVELMTQAAKKSKVLQPLLSAGGGWGEQALGLLHDAAHDWAMGANQVKQWALPDAQRKGDIAERGGEVAGGLAGLGGVAAQFGAAGLAMTGAGQQAAPVYFHVLAKTGSEDQAIAAAMPALGVGATYALPLGKIIAGAGAGTFGKLLLSGLGEGALGATQQVATDAILKKATGEQMSFLKDGAEAGAFGFLTTTILGMLHMGAAKLGKLEGPPGATDEALAPDNGIHAQAQSPRSEVGSERLTSPAASTEPSGEAGSLEMAQQATPEGFSKWLSSLPPPETSQEATGTPQAEEAPKPAEEPIAAPAQAGEAHAANAPESPDGSSPQEPPKPDATQEMPRSSEADLGHRKQATLSGEVVGRHGLKNGPTRSWVLRLDDGTEVHIPAQDESYNIGDRVTLSGQTRKEERVQFTMPGEAKPEPEYAWVLGKHKLVSVDKASETRSPWNPTAEETKARLQSRVDATTPQSDPTQEMLYGGLPPLFQSKEVSSESVRKTLSDGLRKRGAVPEAAFLASEHAVHEVNAQVTQQKINARRLRQAMRKEWGRAAADGQEAKDRVQAALTDPEAMMALPESIRKHAIAARLQPDVNARTMVDQGMVDTPMKATFEKGMGKHLRRQYQAHADPEWSHKIEPEVRNRLKSLLVSWAEDLTPEKTKELRAEIKGPKYGENVKKRRDLLVQIEGLKPNRGDPAVAAQIVDLRAQRKAIKSEMRSTSMPQREAAFELGTRKALQGKDADSIEAQMEHMLADAKATAENPWAAIGASKLKRKDLSLFTARKGLPEEMRAFLGEVKDPIANYASTVMKQAQVIAAHHKFRAMREDGIGKWLFEEPTIKNGAKYVVEVTSGGNKALEPLTKGKPLYTTEEIAKALFQAQPANASKGWRFAIAANALLKAGKTVWSPVTIAKQIPQNFTTALRAGHALDWAKYAKDALGILTGKDEEGLLETTRHGLTGESVAGVEFRDLKNTLGDKKGTVFGKKLHPVYEGARSAVVGANSAMGALFQYPDNFAKIVGWKSETARLVESGMNETQAKLHAADIVRNLYPTAGRIGSIGHGIGPFIDKWRKQPIFGTFMGWNSEKIRTTGELYKLIRSELNSGSPELRANGMKRIGWAIAGEAALPASVLAYNMLNGIDKHEDADRREHVAPWDKGKNIFWTGKKDKGSYITASDIDSNAWTTDSAMRLIAGDKIEDILTAAYREDLAPFIEPSMLSKAIVEQLQGKDFTTGAEKSRADLLWKAVKPGVAQAVELKKGDWSFNSSKAAQQLMGLSGIKPQSFDVRESLKYASYGFLDGLREAKDSEKDRRAVFAEASKKAQSAIRLHIPFDEVRSILHESGLGQETIDAILTGGYRPYVPRKKAE